MNKNDSELVLGLLQSAGFEIAERVEDADIVLINTCSVRQHAEDRALGRVNALSAWKKKQTNRKIGILGCMAERLKEQLIKDQPTIDFVLGPDAYRELPQLLQSDRHSGKSNASELYSGIAPYRQNSTCGWVTIMRGCNNFCAYCIVPYTRGRERSRPVADVLNEITTMTHEGFREITLLGQNVNSYLYQDTNFPQLLKEVVKIEGIKRIRFMTSHPKDLSDELIQVIFEEPKMCSHIHLPIQAGSNRVLELMNRKYTREHYMELIRKTRDLMPEIGISTDIMVGFPGETEKDFNDTLDLVKAVRYDEAFTYFYSPREGTKAIQMPDQLPEEIRKERLSRLIEIQREITLEKKKALIGKTVEVLVESESRQSDKEWQGRTSTNQVIIFPKEKYQRGDLVPVKIKMCKGATLWGTIAIENDQIQTQGRKQCKL